MLQSIPTRIAGAAIVHQTPSRRADGSAVLVRRHHSQSPTGTWLPHEQIITADFAYTCEPSFSRKSVQRTLRCLGGELYACLVDVRVGSPTYGHWQSVCLCEGDARTLSVPAGVACGWQVLSQAATLELRSSCEIEARAWQWLRWNDRDLELQWPELPAQLANHVRPSRSLSSIADHRLPGWTSPKSDRHEHSKRREQVPTPEPRPRLAINTRAAPPKPERPKQPLILVIGSSGQLGRDLSRHLRSLGTVIGACRTPDKQSLLPVPMCVDISRPASLRQAIRQVRPTLIVNAASLTDVEQSEREPRLAQLVNATGPAVMAEEAQRIGASLVHFCSSMVFSGEGDKPWRESDQPNPQNQYARTKLIGTEAVRNSQVPHLILRSGWLYSTHGENYVRRLIDSLSYRNSITLADDHYGNPTSTNFLAGLTSQLLARATNAASQAEQSLGQWLSEHGGLYHAATLGMASRLEVGDQILTLCRQHGLPVVLQKLQGRRLSELPSSATTPANCALDPTRLAMQFQIELPRWQTDLSQQIDLMLGAHSLALSSVA
ncbi:MAG: sugar nucleotide-binding protein [Pirellulaceae bacterium]|jgi:dTDP-4-dehydrorhamnose reductase|nr:sugar nucleotide-binding protein [Pirellulaceae bacterium]